MRYVRFLTVALHSFFDEISAPSVIGIVPSIDAANQLGPDSKNPDEVRHAMNMKACLLSSAITLSLALLPAQGEEGKVSSKIQKNDDYDIVMAQLDQGGSLLFYGDFRGALDNMESTVQNFARKSPEPQAAMFVPVVRSVIDSLGLASIQGYGLSIVQREDGMRRMKSYLRLKDQRGLFALSAPTQKQFSLTQKAPESALVVIGLSWRPADLLPLADEIATQIIGGAGPFKVKEAIRDFEKQTGLNAKETLSALGDELMVIAGTHGEQKLTLDKLPDGTDLSIPRPMAALLLHTESDVIPKFVESKLASSAKPKTAYGFSTLALPVETDKVAPVLAWGNGLLILAESEDTLKAISEASDKRCVKTSAEWKRLADSLPTQFDTVTYVSPKLASVIKEVVRMIPAKSKDDKLTKELAMQFTGQSAGYLSVGTRDANGILAVAQGEVSFGDASLAVTLPTVGVLGAIALPNFIAAQGKAKSSRIRTDQRMVATALEAYFIDNSAYPVSTEDPESKVALKANNIPSFALYENGKALSITTPIAYITTLPKDPYADGSSDTFAYYAKRDLWILWSPGPDQKYDTDYKLLDDAKNSKSLEALFAPFAYDPTNGSRSSGDIIRVKQ